MKSIQQLTDILNTEGAAWLLWRGAMNAQAFVTPEGMILAVNPRLESLLGYSESQLVGCPLSKFIAESDRTAIEETVQDAISMGDDSPSFIATFITKSGGRLTARMKAQHFGNAAELVWSQVQTIDTLSIDSLTPEDEERVVSMLIGRFMWRNKRAVVVAILVMAGIFKMDQLLAILTGGVG